MVLSSRANKFVNARSLVTIFWEGRGGTGRVGLEISREFFLVLLIPREAMDGYSF